MHKDLHKCVQHLKNMIGILQYGDIAMIFRGGCIIRAQFLQKIKEAYDRDAELEQTYY